MRVKNIDRIQFEYYTSKKLLILIDQRLRSTFNSLFTNLTSFLVVENGGILFEDLLQIDKLCIAMTFVC